MPVLNRCLSARKFSSKLPWNFYAVPERRDVGNLISPLPINQMISHNHGVSLLESFTDGIANKDRELLRDITEPLFFEKICESFESTEHSMEIENLRKHDSGFFIYDIENYFLVGTPSLDRTQNGPR